jgi:mono/diheme cytochrome c family protein
MKARIVIAPLLFLQALILVSAQGKTTLDGVYTEAQASRGEAVYPASCAGCHKPDLAGDGQAPALVGKDFDMDWIDLSVGDLFERTRISMPADKPGSLAANDVADVVAFLLSKGKFPAGATELPSEVAALKSIKYVGPKPRA